MSGQKQLESQAWESVFRKHEDVLAREIVGETILVPIRGKLVDMLRIFSLNPVAAHIWQLLDGRRTLGEARDNVLEVFDVQEDRAEADVQEFIGELHDAQLVVKVP